MNPHITASVVLYNSSDEEMQRLLACIGASAIERLYLIDNSPTDRSRWLSSSLPNIVYLHGHGNVGYGAGHNIALRKAMASGARYHVVINPDIYFEGEVIARLASYLDKNSDAGMAMPKVYYPSGELQYTAQLVPSPLDLIARRFLPAWATRRRMNRFLLQFTHYEREMSVPYFMGCFLFLRLSALEEVGLFDERFFMYPEDIDLTRRIHQKYRTLFNPEVQIVHAHAAASRKNLRMLWIHATNMVTYFNKWGWFFDANRRAINRTVLQQLSYTKRR